MDDKKPESDALAVAMAKIAELLGKTSSRPSDETINTSHGIALKLNDHNNTVWSKLMETFIKGKKKLAFIQGDEPPPAEGDEHYEAWGATDAAVRSWIQNSMDPTLVPNFASYDTARDLWEAIATTFFDGNDMIRLYELEKRVSRLRQTGNPIEQYYDDLKSIWRDMDFRQPNPMKYAEDIRKYNELIENRRVLQFLGGLDDRLDPICRELLNATPFPTVDQAFAAVRREQQRQACMTGGENPIGVGMMSRGRPSESFSSSGQNQRGVAQLKPKQGSGHGGSGGATGKPPRCSHCGGKH